MPRTATVLLSPAVRAPGKLVSGEFVIPAGATQVDISADFLEADRVDPANSVRVGLELLNHRAGDIWEENASAPYVGSDARYKSGLPSPPGVSVNVQNLNGRSVRIYVTLATSRTVGCTMQVWT